MNFLWDNWIANLHGPEFLVLFAFVSILAIVWALLRSQAVDDTRTLETPQLPVEFDPHEIAYLRGGVPELVRLIILDLIARKYLQSTETKGFFSSSRKIDIAPAPPEVKYLEPHERVVFNHMRGGKKAEQIFPELPGDIEDTACVREYRAELESRQLLTSAEHRHRAWGAALPPALLVLGLAAYKLSIALSRGRTNIIFLIVMAIIATIALIVVSKPKRLTAIGRNYLARLQSALGMLKGRGGQLATGGANDHLILAVAAFGIVALEGTSLGFYPAMFQKAAQQGATGCGSGCGSGGGSGCGSGCGGGGCGGGCGGCGGCGGG